MSKSTFIICEKSYIIRKGLISIIEKIPGTQIIQQFDNEDEIKDIFNLDSDFIIINPNLLNIEIKKVVQKSEDSTTSLEMNTQIILLSDSSGLKDYKRTEFIDINQSQNKVLAKLKSLIGNQESNKPYEGTPEEISNREVDILKNISLGFSNKEIADKLFISTHTVVTHRKNITRKLGIKTVPGLTIYAILNKIININDVELD